MFDIGFSELLLFGVIALIVLGPEKMPQAARTAGQWYGKMRRMVSTLQSEIEAELDLAETRKLMQDEIAKIRKTEAEMKREMAEMRGSMQEFEQSQNKSLNTMHQLDADALESNTAQKSSEAKADLTKQAPAEFAYDYQDHEGYSENEKPKTPASLSEDESLNEDLNNGSPTVAAQPIITKPWENMWFRLGSYDKARRLPPAPRLPNYQADILLYTQPDTLGNTASTPSSTESAPLAKKEVDE
ncbi:Sec-independent protein translocase protein TatB [Psychrobacter sp. H8-1]|uniref:Sec-independent protein translocase protein TatB n=1 Tax=Psychrobacter sp. H8-1 TaxID=2774129 RepID=UPI001917FD60|nr:Sec-independent protein translocase protein TatB [Psychrobacter sp. H8-1]